MVAPFAKPLKVPLTEAALIIVNTALSAGVKVGDRFNVADPSTTAPVT
jgi:hypothetical protein